MGCAINNPRLRTILIIEYLFNKLDLTKTKTLLIAKYIILLYNNYYQINLKNKF